MEEEFQKTPKKADRWFRLAIVFALLYGITFSLHYVFNWILFFAAGYSFFMSYFLLPVQPKIFQQQRRQQNFGGSRQPNAGTATPVNPAQQVKRIVFGVVGTVFGLFFILVVYFMINPEAAENSGEVTAEEVYDEPTEQSASDYIGKGDDFFNNKEYDSAAVYYQKALDREPDNMMAVYGQGIVLWQTDRKDEAMVKFRQSYEGGNRFWWLSYIMADSYDQQGNTGMAIPLYKESLSLDSACTDCYNRLAALEPENSDKYLKLAQKHPSN